MFVIFPCAVKLEVPFPLPPNVIPVVPKVTVPPVITIVSVCVSAALESVTAILFAKATFASSSLTDGADGAVTTGAEFETPVVVNVSTEP